MPLELVLISTVVLVALAIWAAAHKTRWRARQTPPDISALFETVRPRRPQAARATAPAPRTGALELGGAPGKETVCFVTGRPSEACGCPHHHRRSA